MDTLYRLCRSADEQVTLPPPPAEMEQVVAYKRAYFANEARENPLLREILTRGKIMAFGLEKQDSTGFLDGPATFFRAHEILRKTRMANTPITLGVEEYAHDEVAAWFDRCVPNAKLHYVPWFSPAHYVTSIAIAWGLAVLTGYLVARTSDSPAPLDLSTCLYVGCYATIAAVLYPALSQNRDVRRAAPWNSALYLDLNTSLLLRHSPLLALARKEMLPYQRIKHRAFYYDLARRIETQQFDSELTAPVSRRPASAHSLAQRVRPLHG